MQNLATKRPLLRAGTNKRAQAIPVDIVWGMGLRADDPEAQEPSWWCGRQMFREPLFAVRATLRTCEP